jgi:hypothetical protein
VLHWRKTAIIKQNRINNNNASLGYGLGFRRSKKKTKTKKENWFERLKVDELKEICIAAKLPVKGTKKVIIERLIEDDNTRKYGMEGYFGTNMASLKGECSNRNLVQSGTKLTLVKRLLQKDHGSNPEATAAATKRPMETNADAPSKKKRKPAKPNPEKIHDRVLKKIKSGNTSKMYQSHYGSKGHAPDVYSFIEDLIQNECVEKGYATSDPLFALEVAKSAIVCLSDNFDSMIRPGYDEDYLFGISGNLRVILRHANPLMDEELKTKRIAWIEDFDNVLSHYCLGGNGYSQISYFKGVANTLKETDAVKAANTSPEDSKMPSKDTKAPVVIDLTDASCAEAKMPATGIAAAEVTDDNGSPDAKMPTTDTATAEVTDDNGSPDAKMPAIDVAVAEVTDDNGSSDAKTPAIDVAAAEVTDDNGSPDAKMPVIDVAVAEVTDDNGSPDAKTPVIDVAAAEVTADKVVPIPSAAHA